MTAGGEAERLKIHDNTGIVSNSDTSSIQVDTELTLGKSRSGFGAPVKAMARASSLQKPISRQDSSNLPEHLLMQ